MKAPDILDKALKEQEDRATTYDRKGERSIPRTVNAFNAITGHELSREEGWLFMLLLKAVRSQQGDYRDDNYVDGSSYFSLMGEQAAEDRVFDKITENCQQEKYNPNKVTTTINGEEVVDPL